MSPPSKLCALPVRLATFVALTIALTGPGPAFGITGDATLSSVATAAALENPTVNAGSPGTVLSPIARGAVIPISVTRSSNAPVAGISVTFQLANMALSRASLGGFLSASGGNASGVFVTSNGGGSYTLDAATLGSPCGSTALSGTLFNVTVAAADTNGAGTLVITQVQLRDCANAAMPVNVGTAASVAIDFVGPSISACAPNQTGAVGANCRAVLPDLTAGTAANDAHGPVTVTQSPAAGTLVPLSDAGIGVTLAFTDALDNSSTCATTFTAADRTPPTVTLVSPNGGEEWVAGSAQTVSWTAGDNCTLSNFDLALSTDGGGSFTTIAGNRPIASSFLWTVPASVTTQAMLRVTVRDAAGNASSDATDAAFTIRPTNYAPVLGQIGDQVTDELVPLSFTAVASDLDAGQTLLYSLDAGAPAGASINAGSGLFTWSPTEAQGPGVYSVTFRVTDDGTPVLSAFETITITVNEVDLPAVSLTATPVLTGNDADGTTRVRLGWTPQVAGSLVAVYRCAFGGYPAYDNAGGAVPAAPGAYPPAAAWVLAGTATGASFDDEVAWPARDAYYYTAYVLGQGANVSPPSNRTSGTLNYLLGDVMNPNAAAGSGGHGDNVVNVSDVSLFGANYGLTGASAAAVGYLDIGPTTTGFLDGRPLTDQKIDFEDLMLVSMAYNMPASLVTTRGGGSAIQPLSAVPDPIDRVSIEGPALVHAGDAFTASIHMSASGAVQGLSTTLSWNNSIARPSGATAGSWLAAQAGVVFSPRAGTVDAALLGVHDKGLSGYGVLADVSFTALATGDPHARIATIDARDLSNRPLSLTALAVDTGALRGSTMLWAPAPNPFHNSAQFSVSLPDAGSMELAIYAVDGRRVRVLATGVRAAGEYRLSWDGRGDSGQDLSAGVYFARLETHGGCWVRTVALLK